MNHLAASSTSRFIPYLLILNLVLAFALLSTLASDAEAKRNQKHKANADRHRRILRADNPLNDSSRSGNIHSRKYLDKNYSRGYFRKDYWQGYRGKRIPQGYQGKRVGQGNQGKRVPQGYQGKRVGQGYQVDGYSRRRDNQLRWRRSSPPAKRSPYARKSSTLWKRTPSVKTRTKSLSPGDFGARTEPNLNSSYITPNFGSAPTTTYSNPYGSNPFGTSNDNSQKDDSGTSSKTPDWFNYSLIAPDWSGNN